MGRKQLPPEGRVGPPTSLHFPLPFPCGPSQLERTCRLPPATTVKPRTSLKSQSPRRQAQTLAQEAGPCAQKPRETSRPLLTGAGDSGRGWEAPCGFEEDLGLAVWRPMACVLSAGVTMALSSWERLWVFNQDRSAM